ncbi:MAG: hypothetical protein H6742_05435 [Alphaproteobacteria bacterium]|nr:hypothetical protein [Alphaproteobacteria bacterium]
MLPDSGPHWSDQLAADGPCWRVDLLDGMDEASTAELHDLFDCVNARGTVAPLAPAVDVLDDTGRDGVPLGVELARLVNRLPEVDLDLLGLAGRALDLLEADDAPLERTLELVIELVYATPYDRVAGWDPWTLDDDARLQAGIVAPLLPFAADAAAAVLDDGPAIPGLLVDLLEDPVVADLACTLAGLAHSADPEVAALGDRLIPELAEALSAAGDASNDRWSGASGNSLRDVLAALLVTPASDGRPVLASMELQVVELLSDERVLDNLADTMTQARANDRLAPLPGQLRYLAQVDVDGGGLTGGEDSALVSLLRLLDSANTDVSCTIDLVFTEIDIDLGNLSVSLLSYLADQDPQAAADGIGLLGDVLGWGLSESTLELVADTGVCPVIDRQLVADLGSIDRLSDDEVGDVLVVLLMVLDDVRNGQQDRLPDLVDVISIAHQEGVVPPVEEALRDLGDTGLAADLAVIIGFGLEPEVLAVDACPTGSSPVDFEGSLGLVRAAVAGRPGGSPVEVVQPLTQVAVRSDALWSALDHLGALAAEPDSRLRGAPDLLADLLAVDPELSLVDDLAPLLADRELYGPLLRIAESHALMDVVAAAGAGASGDGEPGVLPWLTRLVTGGTLDRMLRTVDLVVDWLGQVVDDDSSPTTR